MTPAYRDDVDSRRAGVLRRGDVRVLGGSAPAPREREAAAGPLEISAPATRPEWSAAFDDTDVDADEGGGTLRLPGRAGELHEERSVPPGHTVSRPDG